MRPAPRLIIALIVFQLTCVITQSPAAEVSAPRHRVLAADKQRIVRYAPDGTPEWVLEGHSAVHRLQWLPGRRILTQHGWEKLVEIDEDKRIVWEFDAPKHLELKRGSTEIHAFQRFPDGSTMLVLNGHGRIVVVDNNGVVIQDVPYQVSRRDKHRDVRMAQRTPAGHFLLCHELDGRVREYAANGETVWDFAVPLFKRERRPGHGPDSWGNQVFNALRLENGNTLIATGNGHSVLEVNPQGAVVWQVQQHDLPGVTLAWTTTLEVLPEGHLLIGNCHAGVGQPQLIEINRNKEVIWTFYDWDLLGDATAASTVIPVLDLSDERP